MRCATRIWTTSQSGARLVIDGASRQKEFVDYSVRLVTTRPNFGGWRWWFICPLVVDGQGCNRRTAKLYLPPGDLYYGCRPCYRLTYRSVQEGQADGHLPGPPRTVEAARPTQHHTPIFSGEIPAPARAPAPTRETARVVPELPRLLENALKNRARVRLAAFKSLPNPW